MYFWEHVTRVFLPQPKKLDLEITDLVYNNISSHKSPVQCAAPTIPLLAGKSYKWMAQQASTSLSPIEYVE